MEAPWGIIACHQDLLLCLPRLMRSLFNWGLGHVIQPCTLPFAYGNNGTVNESGTGINI